MTKRQLLIVLGIWVMVFLFINFPSTWDKVFALVTGLLIIIVALKLKPTEKKVSAGQVPYVEHKNPAPIISNTNTITNSDPTAS